MSIHLFGALVTHLGTAANNRGETEGNITTLQKLLWNDAVHTTVSAEAIRWAVRYRWQQGGLTVRRQWDDTLDEYKETTDYDATKYIDDDVLGFMLAEGAKAESNPAEAPAEKGKGKAAPKAKGTINRRRGVLEVTRAVSLVPFAGDITFNAKAGTKTRTSLYGTEVHATRYQYGFALTPGRLADAKRAEAALDALLALGEVAGNHSRFLYDFSPESVALRVSHDPSPRFLYCFAPDGTAVAAPRLVAALASKDIAPTELIVGGAIASTATGKALAAAGATVVAGVREAGEIAKKRLREAR